MAVDALLALQASVTKTATFNGAGLALANGTPRRGLVARVLYSAANNASGSNSFTFSLDWSTDNGGTWNSLALAAPLVLTTTAQIGEIDIPFITPNNPSGGQVRLTVTLTGAGSTPTVTYSANIGNAFP